MGKNFTLQAPANPTGIVRLPDGRFARPPIPSPDHAVAEAERGVPIKETVEKNPAVEYDEPKLFGPLPVDPDSPAKPFRLR